MGTNYPGAVDSFTNPAAGDALNSPSHAAQHADANDAIEAVQGELGATPSGSEATVAARLDKIEDGTRLGTNSVGATQLADNAVDTAAIADGAATPAKLATTGRFVFPTGAANGYGFASGAVHLSGTGAPEAAVTATPGSTWLQTDSTVDVKGWLRWVKATGTGNTGWVAGPEADTGWRDVSGALNSGWTGTLMVARRGSQVSVRFINLAAGSGAAYNTPSGFRHAYSSAGTEMGAGSASVYVDSNGIEPLGTAKGYAAAYIMLSYPTSDAWPSSLPGSAA